LKAQVKRNLKNNIIEYICDAILNDEYKQNDQIKEVHLANKLEVSRVPIREALQELVNLGILEQIERRGVFVKAVTDVDIFDTYQAQGIIEGALATSFAIHATQEDMDLLDELLLKMCDGSNSSKVTAFYGRQFHDHCLKYATNKVLLYNLEQINKKSLLMYSKNLYNLYTLDEVQGHHQKVVDALKTRNKDEIERVIKEHYFYTGSNLVLAKLNSFTN